MMLPILPIQSISGSRLLPSPGTLSSLVSTNGSVAAALGASACGSRSQSALTAATFAWSSSSESSSARRRRSASCSHPSFPFVLSDERDKLIGRPCGDCGVWTHGRGGGRGRGSEEEEEGSRSASESESSRRRVERKRERRRPSVWRREREGRLARGSFPSFLEHFRPWRRRRRAWCGTCGVQRRHAVSRPSSMVHVRLSALQCRMYQSAEMKAYVPTDGWGTGGLRLHKATKCSSRLGGRWL